MAEGLESGAAVIPAHAALAHTAEGHGTGGEMNDGVVDAAAAKMAVIQDPSLGFFIFTEEIQRQRMRMFLHTTPNPQNLPRRLGFQKPPR